MKKTLSFVLVAAMLLCMIPALGVFADAAPDYTSIDSVEEYVEFAKAVDAGTYTNNADHKVNVDLDFTGYDAEDVVISKQVGDLQLDFQGHTVSGIVRDVTLTDHGNVGLLIDNAPNWVEILNVKIKDCKLVVNCPINDKGYAPWAMVGGVIGRADRAYTNNVDFENVTIELNGPGAVGLAYGEKTWNDFRGPDIAIATKNVVVKAPDAEGVGLVIGRMGDVNDDTISVTALNVTDTTIAAKNEITATAYVGTGSADHITLKEGVVATVSLVDNATGYTCPHKNTEIKDAKEATETEEGYTGDKVCNDCGATVEEGTTIPKVEPAPDTTEQPTTNEESPKTGDATLALVALSVVSLLGMAVVAKKRA